MGNSGWTADPADILVPPSAGPNDPRIYIGPNDPIAQGQSQDAAIVLYWADQRAFIISVEQSGGPDFGQLHIWSIDEINNLKQLVDIDHDVTGDNVQIIVGQNAVSGESIDSIIIGTDVVIQSEDDLTLQTRAFNVAGDINLGGAGPKGFERGEVKLYGKSLGRGLVARAALTAGSAAIGAAETVVMTALDLSGNPVDYQADRAYRAEFTGSHTVSVAPNNTLMRVRKTNAAGQQINVARFPAPNAATSFDASWSCVFTVGAADITGVSMVLTLTGGGAFNSTISAAATSPAEFTITDIGPATDHPNMPVLV